MEKEKESDKILQKHSVLYYSPRQQYSDSEFTLFLLNTVSGF